MTETERKTKTEEKILDAALKVFARKGYAAATTRVIAEESGFTEMTLFRKFKTKQNLFDRVMEKGDQQIEKNSATLFTDHTNEEGKEFIEAFVKSFDEFVFKNFEYFHLTVQENRVSKSNLGKIIDNIGKYFKEQFPTVKLDYNVFGHLLSTFIYSLNIDKYYGRTASFDDYDKSLGNFVDILDCMLEIKTR